jgi:hypothetical protein
MGDSVYFQARKERDDRYADLALGKRNWQIPEACSIAVSDSRCRYRLAQHLRFWLRPR